MIGFLEGKILFKEKDSLILRSGGIGWQIFVPQFTWQRVKEEQQGSFFIYTYVREDEIKLYAFPTLEHKKIFKQLISVSGIGASLGLNIISFAKNPKKIIEAIQKADVDFFITIKGIGKKSSQRIIVDLKSKIGSLQELEFEGEKDQDLVNALKGLGFSQNEIKEAIKGIDKNLKLEEKIKKALKKNN